MEKEKNIKLEYFSVSGLKHRGWTEGKIKLWLKDADKLVDNPHYRCAPKSKLYESKRVLKFEKRKIFKEWFENSKNKREKISLKQKEIHNNKKEELIKYINNLNIEIEVFSEKELYERAIYHYNDLWFFRENYEKTIYQKYYELEKSFLNRITINMLRHNYSYYEEELSGLFGKSGKEDCYELLKEKVNNKIYEIYPFLN